MSVNLSVIGVYKDHSEDVQCVDVLSKDIVATGSRDGTVIIWKRKRSGELERMAVLTGHTDFVRAITHTEKYLVTGSRDKTVRVYDLNGIMEGKVDLLATLEGHKSDVYDIASIPGTNHIATVSWDSTVRVWNLENFDCVNTVNVGGYLYSVEGFTLGMLPLFVTAGSSRVLNVHSSDGTIVARVPGAHLDVIRCVRHGSHNGGDFLVTAGNDAQIRIWQISLQDNQTSVRVSVEPWNVTVSHGHSFYIYDLDVLNGRIFSVSEDMSLRVTSVENGSLLGSRTLPAIPWTVRTQYLEEEATTDILVGMSDGALIHLTDNVLLVNEELEDTLAARLEEATWNRDVLSATARDVPALPAAGSVGQRFIVDDVVYEWNASELEWRKIGSIEKPRAAVPQRNPVDGKMYDVRVLIELDGRDDTYLYFNYDQNPYEVAQKFVVENGLDPSYTEQIVDFLLKNFGDKMMKRSSPKPRTATIELQSIESDLLRKHLARVDKGDEIYKHLDSFLKVLDFYSKYSEDEKKKAKVVFMMNCLAMFKHCTDGGKYIKFVMDFLSHLLISTNPLAVEVRSAIGKQYMKAPVKFVEQFHRGNGDSIKTSRVLRYTAVKFYANSLYERHMWVFLGLRKVEYINTVLGYVKISMRRPNKMNAFVDMTFLNNLAIREGRKEILKKVVKTCGLYVMVLGKKNDPAHEAVIDMGIEILLYLRDKKNAEISDGLKAKLEKSLPREKYEILF